ncbi:MAG: Rho termination factor N-terminal domain-containing protein [Bacilli bacterium]
MQKAVDSVKKKEDRPRRFEDNRGKFNKGNKKPFEKKSFVKESNKEKVEAKKEEKPAKKEEKAVVKEDLTKKTVAELREMAKAKDIKGYSTMKKQELVDALK